LCSDAWAALPAPGQALSCNTRWGSTPLCTQAHLTNVIFPKSDKMLWTINGWQMPFEFLNLPRHVWHISNENNLINSDFIYSFTIKLIRQNC
jgi:hypothetical protein